MELSAPSAGPVLPGEGTKVGWAESTEGTRGGVLVGTEGRREIRRGGEVTVGTIVRLLGLS